MKTLEDIDSYDSQNMFHMTFSKCSSNIDIINNETCSI